VVYWFTRCWLLVPRCSLLVAGSWLLVANHRSVDHFVKRSFARHEHALYVWKTESAIAPERNVLLQFWNGDDALLLGSLFEL